MKVIENIQLDNKKYALTRDAFFIRIDPEDYSITLKEIIKELFDMSWLNNIMNLSLRAAYESRATKTCEFLKKDFNNLNDDKEIKDEAGEYIVSVLSKKALINEYNHKDIPLTEMLGRKIINNPGFDFYTEKDYYVTAGEAKYKNGSNPYNISLSQINDFIKMNKHIEDIPIIINFINQKTADNIVLNKINVCCAFSSYKIKTPKLLKNITNSKYFKECNKSHIIYLIAVEMV